MRGWVLAVSALAAALTSVDAHAQQWRLSSDEFGCWVATDQIRLSDSGGQRQFEADVTLPVDRRIALTVAYEPSGGSIPGFSADQTPQPAFSNEYGEQGPRLVVQIRGSVTRAHEASLRRSGAVYLVMGRRYLPLQLGDFGAAVALLDQCRPVVPPPNRVAGPRNRVSDWIDPEQAAGFPLGRFVGFVADIDIDARGKFVACRTATSTGNEAADAKFCEIARRRGRFRTATDAQSRHIPGTFRTRFPGVEH